MNKIVTHARSKKNGIIFYSDTIPGMAVDAFIDEKNEINVQVIPQVFNDFFEHYLNREDNIQIPILNCKLALFLKVLVIIFVTVLFKNICFSTAVLYGCIYFRDWLTVAYSAYNFTLGKRRDIARFHAAEHQVINAYCNLQRVPILEEIKSSSRFSEHCGSMTILNRTLPTFAFTLCFFSGMFLPPMAYFILFIALSIVTLTVIKFHLLKYFQIFFTKKPSNLELEVALKGIQAYDDMENDFKQLMDEANTPCGRMIFSSIL